MSAAHRPHLPPRLSTTLLTLPTSLVTSLVTSLLTRLLSLCFLLFTRLLSCDAWTLLSPPPTHIASTVFLLQPLTHARARRFFKTRGKPDAQLQGIKVAGVVEDVLASVPVPTAAER